MAKPVIGIRREDKNIWERRAPIVPEHVAALVREHGVEVLLQKSDLRVIPAADYARAGAQVVEDLSPCRVIFAVKEIPLALLQKGKTYVFFSHTIKGQAHNMPMLRRMRIRSFSFSGVKVCRPPPSCEAIQTVLQ